jgi:hypothetical protein
VKLQNFLMSRVQSTGQNGKDRDPMVTLTREFEMKRPSMQIGLGIALGAGIGIALALALGSGSAWLGIGIAIGVAIGAAMSSRRADSLPRETIRNDKGFDFLS